MAFTPAQQAQAQAQAQAQVEAQVAQAQYQAHAQARAQSHAHLQAQAQSQAALDTRILAERSPVLSRVHSNPPAALQPSIDEMAPLRPAHTSSLHRGPRAGYFSDDRGRAMRAQVNQLSSLPPPVPQEPVNVNSQPDVIGMQNVARMGSFAPPLSRPTSVPQPLELQDIRYHQSMSRSHGPASQPASYMSSRPNSPAQSAMQSQRYGKNMPLSLAHPDALVSSNLSSTSFMGARMRSPAPSPTKDMSWPASSSSASHQIAESRPPPARQVPAKRSNIVNILNDESEDPQPRKRFAAAGPSEPAGPSSTSGSAAYPSLARSPRTLAHDEMARQQGSYGHGIVHSLPSTRPSPMHTPVNVPVRPYTEPPTFPSMSSSTMGPSSQDWMMRLDPRNQHMGQGLSMADHHYNRLSKQPSNMEYSSHGPPSGGSASRRHQSPHPQYVDSYQQPLSQSYMSHSMSASRSGTAREQPIMRSPGGMESPRMAYHQRVDSPSQFYSRSLTRPTSPAQVSVAGMAHRKRLSPTPQPPPPYMLSNHTASYVPHPLDKPSSFSPHSQRGVSTSSPLHTPKLQEHPHLASQANRESGNSLLSHNTTSPSHGPLSRPASVLQAAGGLGPIGLGGPYTPPAVHNPASQGPSMLYSNVNMGGQRNGPVLHPMRAPMPSGSPPPDRHRQYGHER